MCNCECEYSSKIKMLSDEQAAIKKYIDEQIKIIVTPKIKTVVEVLTNHDKEIHNWVHLKIDNAMANIKDKCKIDTDWESD